MSKKQNGGPAFPTESMAQGAIQSRIAGGMSLRDYFAAKWLQGWMANPSTSDANREDAARWSYEMADAMLKARSEE